MLARSERIAFKTSCHEETTFRLFGFSDGPSGIPAASVRYLSHLGKPTKQYCVCIDPVHLRTETSGLSMVCGSPLAITDEESHAFQHAIRTLFAEDGWTLVEGDKEHWYLCSDNSNSMQSSPISTVIGKSITNYLPGGTAGKEWQLKLNEVQMLLHSLPENEQRVSRGQLPINSVWLWGEGQSPRDKGKGFTVAYTTDPLTKGLAQWTKTRVSNMFSQMEDCIATSTKGDSIFIQIDSLLEASLYGDFIQWSEKLSSFETKCFIPLWDALRRGKLGLVEVIAGDGYLYQLKRSYTLRFWRK